MHQYHAEILVFPVVPHAHVLVMSAFSVIASVSVMPVFAVRLVITVFSVRPVFPVMAVILVFLVRPVVTVMSVKSVSN